MWREALPPRTVRESALELLHALAAVEAEALLAAPGLRGALMGDLARHLLASFTSAVQGQLPDVSRGGLLQVRRKCRENLGRTHKQLFQDNYLSH